MAGIALTAGLVGGLAAAPAEAAGSHTVRVSIPDSICGGSVVAVQFGAVPGISSAPYQQGRSANIRLLGYSGNVQFTGTAWCTHKFLWWKWTTPQEFSKSVYVSSRATSVSL